MNTRSRLARRLSWLVVASLAIVALVAPTTAVRAASVAPQFPGGSLGQNPTCADLAAAYGNGQTWLELTKFEGQATNGSQDGVTIFDATGDAFSWSSTIGIDAVLVKAGSDNHAVYVYAPTSDSDESFGDTDLANGPNQQGISHISFCYDTTNPEPTPTPTATPEPTPTATPTATPQGALFSVPAFSIECGGSITVTNFAAANVDDVLITPSDTVIDGDGTFPLEPGEYTAVGRVGGEVVTDEVAFTIEACPTEPTPTPTPAPTLSVLLAAPACDGDVPYLDYEVDGTGADPDVVTITFLHPTDPTQNVVYSDLPLSGRVLWPGAEVDDEGTPVEWPGWSFVDGVWVEGDEFDWVRPSVQVRFEVSAETTVTVDYPPSAPLCDANPPEGEVGGATGTPGVTLPPTDTALTQGGATQAGDGWRLILLAMAGLLAAALLLTPASAVVSRKDDRQG